MALGFDGLRAEIARRRRRRLDEGGWFLRFMQRHARKVMEKQRKAAKADALRAKFEEGTPDELCAVAVRNASLWAAFVGAMAGAIITVAEIYAIITFGFPFGFAILVALIEFGMLERMQIRMVFTLAELRGLQMGHEHMHDVSALYGHVLKVKGATRAAAYGRQGALILFRAIGFRFVQRAALKFAIPLIAIVMGGLLNYWLTRALGAHTDAQFRKRIKVDDRLQRLVSHHPGCQQLLVGLMSLMASGDGVAHKRERELIMRTLDSMGVFGEARVALLDALELDEERLLGQLSQHPNDEFRGLVLELMTLTAVADGQISENEHRLLGCVAQACGHPLDQALLDELIDEHSEFLNRKVRRARQRS